MSTDLYEGRTRHHRFTPKVHRFEFALWLAFLDADAPEGDDGVFAPGGGARLHVPGKPEFQRADYLDGDVTRPLGAAVRELVAERTGVAPAGPVRTLTQLRTNGYVFNPITVHYCYAVVSGAPAAPTLEAIVLEVTNTPWKERHSYVIDLRPGTRSAIHGSVDDRGRIHATFPKELHVSPFLTMDEEYRFSASVPGDRLWLGLENHRRSVDGATSERVFRADLTLHRVESDTAGLRRVCRRHRVQTARVWAGIHFHAAVLAAKRVRFQPHPKRSS